MAMRQVSMTAPGLAAALVLAGLLRPAGTAPPRPRNLLVITLDTIRADRLPPYGFNGVAAPALERIAAEGVVFEQTFAAVPLTLPSHATLFTGLYPPRLGVRDNVGAPLAPEFATLAEVLRERRGLTNAAFVASSVLAPGRGIDQGFAVYSDGLSRPCSGAGRARRPADDVVDEALSWFGRHDSTPFFVWMHLYDTHRPYTVPDEYARLYSDPYLAAIAFQDAQISRLTEYLEERGQLNDTLLVIVGDHGESLGQHGETTHGIFVYQEALHVPFIIRGPGISPRRVGAVTRLVDVMPTILDFFGVRVTDVDGVSVAGLATGTAGNPHLEVYAESLYPLRFGWAPLRSLRADRYKVVEAPRPELYDLANDPGEERNIFDERPEVGRAMLNRLAGFDGDEDRAPGRMPVVDRVVAERIAALGYVGTAPEQTPRAAGNEPDPKDRIATFNQMTAIQSQKARPRPASQGSCGPN